MITGVWKDISGIERVLDKLGIKLQEKLKAKVGNGLTTRFWRDIWITDQPLLKRFPDLFNLAKRKNDSVASYLQSPVTNGFWSWDWVRAPESPSEWSSFATLMAMLQQVVFSGGKDCWAWQNDAGNPLEVKTVRMEIMAKEIEQEGGDQAPGYWNSWATPKSNYLLWRALLGKVASKVGLQKRGFWWNVFIWIKVPLPQDMSKLGNIFTVLHNSPGCRRWKKLVMMIATATVWKIWHARNTKTFDGIFIPIRKMVDQLKEETYLWICHRAKIQVPKWEDWLDFNVTNAL
ncbi:uncharacterized protein LOC110887966 [Helianthus annuus]|uniref:uncharacterized protein LOC110887966 n=1 Tax=Helianthus annuus TaxID=4232 RepID=UPI000B8EFD84|nr:uncharacterized protein LOC110887966 [Helianthus annuus]